MAKSEKVNPAQFVREVRQETRKVIWPTRRETLISGTLVLVMASIMAIFFLVVDQIIAWGIQLIL